jgi:lipopolysaccharide/colanic/teichoic acid biosynthesis glycosyltransferase
MEIHDYYSSKRKRLFDIAVSLILLPILLPLFAALCLLVFIESGKPVIYKQLRVGKNKKKFTIFKIRTMRRGASLFQQKLAILNEAPPPMFKISNDPRFTKIGKKLSRTGLDELPQIINVLKGEMSLIGPRPLPVREANKLNESWNFRYLVNPGLLSKWALSSKRHESLQEWRKLEINELKSGSIYDELQLILDSVNKVIIKNLFAK